MKRNLTLVLIVLIASGLQQANAQWKANGANIFNTNTGNVGIGTQSPGNKLVVKTGDNTWGMVHTNGSVSAGLYTGSGGGWLGTKSNNPLYFCTSLGNTNFLAQMTILPNGNIGVATLNPQSKLEVQTPDQSWGMVHTSGNVSAGFYTGSGGGWVGTKSNSPLYFCTSLGNKNFNAQMTLLTNGNLGVGTLSPTAKLYVITSDQTTATYSASNAISGIGITGEANNSATFSYPRGVQGICKNPAGWAGYFQGDIGYTGGSYPVSDQRLKENIKPIDKILDKIMLLKPSKYNFRSGYSKMNLPKGEQVGFIAQDIEKVFPHLVKTTVDRQADNENTSELKSLNYIGLIPLLTKAIQEQQEEISDLKQEVRKLSGNISPSENTSAAKVIDVIDAALTQNNPNPFSNSTTIQYNIPARFKSAQLVIADANGSIIKQVSITTTGKGTVNVNSYNLSSGTYTYALVVDGRTIDSKKMIVGK